MQGILTRNGTYQLLTGGPSTMKFCLQSCVFELQSIKQDFVEQNEIFFVCFNLNFMFLYWW